MGRSRFVVKKRSQSGNGQEHMYERWHKKNLRSERCDRNSFSSSILFCLLCPFIFAYIVYTLNWLHFWHWGKASRRNMKHSVKRTHQTHWRPSVRLLSLLSPSLFYLLRIHFQWRIATTFGLDWSWIDKNGKSLITLTWSCHGLSFVFWQRVADRASQAKERERKMNRRKEEEVFFALRVKSISD